MMMDPVESYGDAVRPVLHQTALIHIGANAVSMLIMEAPPDAETIELLEFLEQPVALAEDIFRDGKISRSNAERCVHIIRRFYATLNEYGLGPDHGVTGVGTNILSEADNCELFLNRLQIACQLELRPLDEGDMTRLVYFYAARVLKGRSALKKKQVLVAHIGPGNTRLMIFRRGRLGGYASYRIGAHRVAEAVERMPSGGDGLTELIKGHINGMLDQIEDDYANYDIDAILAFGQEIQPVAAHLGVKPNRMEPVPLTKLARLKRKLTKMDEGEIASYLNVDIHTASAMVPGLLCHIGLADRFHMEELQLAGGRFEENFLINLASGEFTTKRFEKEVIESAIQLGKRYKFDQEHGIHVANLCATLFETLQSLHNLTPQDELLLRVAGILHEVGYFVSRRSHHKHSLYIIQHSEIFGLNDEETVIVGLVARYHRRAFPQPTHAIFCDLPRADRIRVSKLAAILRVADALDRSHTQRVAAIKARLERDHLVLQVGKLMDVRVEELALKDKANFFEGVYGLEVVLETV